MSSSETDLLPCLRRCTGPLHDRIEALLLLEAPMPLARYGLILRGFHEFLQLWEQRIRFALPSHLQPWYDERRRSSLAAQDIATLGIPEAPALRQAARMAQALIHLDSPAVAIGALYVIEGSALGGQVLTPRLATTLGLTPSHGASYFHGFGERTGAMWREFRLTAQQEVGTDAQALADACRGAVQTFTALIETFDALDTGTPTAPPQPDAAVCASSALA